MFFRLILCFLSAFILTYIAIPSIINIAKAKRLTDDPDERRSHNSSIPTLGGIGIFAGVIFSIILWTPFEVFGNLQYILCAYVIIFLVGAKDDIIPLTPYKKLIGLLLATAIIIFKANIKITSLYGIFGVNDLIEWVSVLLSAFTILVIINAFNLIDGINGLGGSMGILISITFGTWFYMTDQIVLSIIAIALAGSLVAFLKFNITPAKIFMGDTGSLLIGINCAILTISFIEMQDDLVSSPYRVFAAPAVAMGILFMPLFDTLRVFIVRILMGRSPFSGDRLHIHHILVDSGWTHIQATALLIAINTIVILMALQFQKNGNLFLLASYGGIGISLSVMLYLVRKKREPTV